jgi:hypothetical protein
MAGKNGKKSRRNDREAGRNGRGVRINKRGAGRREDEEVETEENQGGDKKKEWKTSYFLRKIH